MGAYKASIVTEKGQNLIAQALADNKTLLFTSAKTSSYAYPIGTNIPALTGLQDIIQSVQPFKSQVVNNNVTQVSVRFDNDEITQQYMIQTIGLYAQVEGGEEILFSVTQAITPDEMPVRSDISPSAFIYNIQLTIQNAQQITMQVNPTGTATIQDILDIQEPEFDDSGEVEEIKSFPDFLARVKSKMNFFGFLRDFKAGMQFVLHVGDIVNNCKSDETDKPLSAAQGKALMELYTQLNSNFVKNEDLRKFVAGYNKASNIGYVSCYDNQGRKFQINVKQDALIGVYQPAGGTEHEVWRAALKSDLANFINLSQIVTETQVTLEANTNGSVDIPFTVPDGYKYLGAIDAWTDNANVMTTNHYRTNEGTIKVNIKSFSSQTVTFRVYIYTLCVHI